SSSCFPFFRRLPLLPIALRVQIPSREGQRPLLSLPSPPRLSFSSREAAAQAARQTTCCIPIFASLSPSTTRSRPRTGMERGVTLPAFPPSSPSCPSPSSIKPGGNGDECGKGGTGRQRLLASPVS